MANRLTAPFCPTDSHEYSDDKTLSYANTRQVLAHYHALSLTRE